MIERSIGSERIEIGKRIISFIGPEGSGKTDNSNLLSIQTGKPYLTTGSILRELATNDPGYYGEKAREMFASHTYLDGKLLLEIMCDRFSKEDTSDGFVLDGGFRTVEETDDFEKTLIKAGRNFPVTVIYLNIPLETIYERLITGEKARKRNDDTKEALDSRLEKFFYRLEERLDLIRKNPNWDLVEIDALPPLNIVYKNVYELIIHGKTEKFPEKSP